MICSSSEFSRLDLAFVQVYQALRQQLGESAQRDLRREAEDFGAAVRSYCHIAVAQSSSSTAPPPPPPPPDALACAMRVYSQQRQTWLDRVRGAAAEEARRPAEQQIEIQAALQRLGYLPPTAVADGVFGQATRNAILAWQNAQGRAPTGLMGSDDAAGLLGIAPSREAASTVAPAAPPDPTNWQPKPPQPKDVQKGMTQDDVTATIGYPDSKDRVPPEMELWRYRGLSVVFTSGRVTFVGR